MSVPTPPPHPPALSRRSFLTRSTLTVGGLITSAVAERRTGLVLANAGPAPVAGPSVAWFRRVYRWGQTNLTEEDPAQIDVAWWREYWRRTRVQGVIVNAAGIVAYYPSKFPLQYRAQTLGDRDLFGELAAAAHEEGLAVLARMDSNRAHEAFYRAHPDWFARDLNGHPYRAGDLYVTCVNSPYYEEWIPGILREIIGRAHPEGFTDNSWSGLGRSSICYCDHCQRRFRERTGKNLPREKVWSDPVYREWIEWNYARRLELWDLNNQVTRDAGGPDCLWIGMNSGSLTGQSQSFRDDKEICRRAEILLLDHQARNDASGFQQNSETGKRMHGLLGWDKLMPESMALYQAGKPTFRKAAKPESEARLWILEGIAGGIQPWWHHVGARQEDRRQFHTIESLNRWHEAHQQFLTNRQPVATIGVLWSRQNADYYGRDHAEELVELPYRGIINALVRARIPYQPVHADHLTRESPSLAAIILPNLAVMNDDQLSGVRQFVQKGGGLLATGDSSLFDPTGEARPDFALADLFGAHWPEDRPPGSESVRAKEVSETIHSYLRLPADATKRHPILQGFEETDILAYGGRLEPLQVANEAQVALTFVPPFPVYPPETSWMREPNTKVPALILREEPGSGRVAYLPADLDRRFARDNLPDHGDLLAKLVRWAARDRVPLQVEGAGFVDCALYHQRGRLLLHLVNLTNSGTWRQPVQELIPIGPLTVRVQLPADVSPRALRLLVSEEKPSFVLHERWAAFTLPKIYDHELVLFA